MKVINDELGGWPLISGKSNPYSPLELLKRVNKYELADLVAITVGANPKNPDRNIIKVVEVLKSIDYKVLLKLFVLYRFRSLLELHMNISLWINTSKRLKIT